MLPSAAFSSLDAPCQRFWSPSKDLYAVPCQTPGSPSSALMNCVRLAFIPATELSRLPACLLTAPPVIENFVEPPITLPPSEPSPGRYARLGLEWSSPTPVHAGRPVCLVYDAPGAETRHGRLARRRPLRPPVAVLWRAGRARDRGGHPPDQLAQQLGVARAAHDAAHQRGPEGAVDRDEPLRRERPVAWEELVPRLLVGHVLAAQQRGAGGRLELLQLLGVPGDQPAERHVRLDRRGVVPAQRQAPAEELPLGPALPRVARELDQAEDHPCFLRRHDHGLQEVAQVPPLARGEPADLGPRPGEDPLHRRLPGVRLGLQEQPVVWP